MRRLRHRLGILTVLYLILITTSAKGRHDAAPVKGSVDRTGPGFQALVDSAMRCSLAGMHAAGIALLDQAAELGTVDRSKERRVVLEGLRAAMFSELGLLDEAESRFREVQSGVKALPYAPYGACLRAYLAVHHYRMGRREDAFNLITAAVRFKGDAEHCEAEAAGFYHLGVLHSWEGFDSEALQGFAMATRTIDRAPGKGADAARYWAAYAEALEAVEKTKEAQDAYDRAYRAAIEDPVSRTRYAATIALRHGALLLRLQEPAKAEDMLRRAEQHADAGACPALLGGIHEMTARYAFRYGTSETAQRRLVEALWHYYRGMTDASCSLTRTECQSLRRSAKSALDLAFSTLLREAVRDPLLAAAAWNTHLALRAFRGDPVCSPAAVKAEDTHHWLQERLAGETRCLAGNGDGMHRLKGPTLRGLQARLPRDGGAILIRRFVDVRAAEAVSGYAAVVLTSNHAIPPRMIWLDAAGNFERELLPRLMRSLHEPLFLEDVTDWSSLPAALQALPPERETWAQCVAPVLHRLPTQDPLLFFPDGIFLQIDPAFLYDPDNSTYLADQRRVITLHSTDGDGVDVQRDAFTSSVLVEDAADYVRTPVAAPVDGLRDAVSGAFLLEDFFREADEQFPEKAVAEDRDLRYIDGGMTEQEVRRMKMGRVLIYDVPVFLLDDTGESASRVFLPALPRTDDPYVRGGLLLSGARSV
ncbi:MAG: tetratricopeptide repeat protein, partial [Bacteroidetes bacterium]|nr:tetratricopeptide repeat protein [Bacteroidota bacterium]